MFHLQLTCNSLYVCVGLLDSPPRFQARIEASETHGTVRQNVRARFQNRIRHHSRKIDVGLDVLLNAGKGFRSNADNLQGMPVDSDFSADDVRISGKVSLPDLIRSEERRVGKEVRRRRSE